MTNELHDNQDFPDIAKYRILKQLGSGTYGRVYLGQHRLLDRQVAIKIFLGNIDTKKERERFLQEARLLDQLKHPHILQLYDVGIQEGLFERDIAYLLMEYAPGGSLRDRLDAHGPKPLPLGEALRLLSQIGEGLSYAHQHKVVHRDLKPENILFNAKGDVLLADFGIAIVLSSGTQSGESIGTPAYMAPEQLQGVVSRKSDQYALGCIAYELLTGRQPFVGPDRHALAYQHLHNPPSSPRSFNPDLPICVEKALLRAMAKKRDDRYPDIPTFLTALHDRPPVPLDPAPPLVARNLPQSPISPLSRVPHNRRKWREELLRENPFEPLIEEEVLPKRLLFSKTKRRAPLPSVPHDHVFISRIRVAPTQSPISRPGRGSFRKSRDWSIVLLCLLGCSITICTVILFISLGNISSPLYPLFGLAWAVGMLLLFLGVARALLKSYRTKAWRWFTALVAGPGLLGLIGLLFGSIGGFSLGLVFGLLISALICIFYGWHHSPTTTHPLAGK